MTVSPVPAIGLYRVHWLTGGCSVAAIGKKTATEAWVACLDGTSPNGWKHVAKKVKYLEPLTGW